ncbi:molybdopterin-dependent oxidoreductase [Tessaracoccus rhinocerotis]|uniref:Molybdopterin-dependent oxidoreductase n=1 Tax=Tessaracoccus rhinocerotis TaxID=1689449 RepID=A0A553K2U0_9ACTN|nr:molybdopterin-dependent oxidoreductase [Tessaracoccus rhinocerotis]TRY19017.1 molybdopterin-dependent oxidoreductase [Tessaracoccus rhinocerotis]
MTPRTVTAAIGIAAGAVTLGVSELLAAALARTVGTAATPSPLLAVGAAFVDLTPPWLKDWAIATFGSADKVALFVGMGLVLSLLCALLGVLAGLKRPVGTVGLLAGGALAAAAVITRADATWVDVLPTAGGVTAGILVLRTLLESATGEPGRARPGRRELLARTGGAAALGLVGLAVGRGLQVAVDSTRRAREELELPDAAEPVVVPATALATVTGQTAFQTPNDAFYRIDTALVVPQVDPATWTLRVTGLVENELKLNLADLLAERHVESMVTLTCVSNPVGGGLAGNAVWTGWPVRELLERAGVRPDADMVLSRSIDGWTAGTPIEALTDGRDALLAVGMNGEPLPPEHGFPVRLVVPGLYGYVSATKWVNELKVTRFDADEGYWTPRGWAERGPVKTASRIDVPRDGARLPAGATTVAGVAWAQTRGVDAVEVSADGGPWLPAELRDEPTIDAWRLWSLTVELPPGDHQLRVRATDGLGRVQTERTAPPVPDGSSGWHTISVTTG